MLVFVFFFSSRRRHTRCALVTGVQTCALPIWAQALRAGEVPARVRAAAKPSLVERLLGFPLRPAVSALAGLALLLACAGAFELGRYQAERLDSLEASVASESELPVEFLMGGLLEGAPWRAAREARKSGGEG